MGARGRASQPAAQPSPSTVPKPEHQRSQLNGCTAHFREERPEECFLPPSDWHPGARQKNYWVPKQICFLPSFRRFDVIFQQWSAGQQTTIISSEENFLLAFHSAEDCLLAPQK